MNWSHELFTLLEEQNDTLSSICIKQNGEDTFIHPGHPQFFREFDGDFVGIEGCPFTAWGEKNVYFPAQYEGSEWIAYVPRNPTHKATLHVGGG